MMRLRPLPLVLSLLVLPAAIVAGCGKATPVAPVGTTIQLTVSPTLITTTGSAQATAVVRRENGSPVNPGTIVRFTATLGTITETSATDAQGVARATLTSDGRIGTAKVVASSGPVTTDAIEVQIGLQAGTVSLSATPSTVKETGGQIKLIALLRDASGQPLAGALTNFPTQIGTLASGGAFVTSSSGGQAQDTLNLSSADVSTLSGDTFTVKVSVSGASDW